ncbi:MAG: CvpA family protein [Pseudomonadota bacterium]
MNWVDFVILGILGVSILISLWRGFTREALSLAGWVLAVWVALMFSDNLEHLLRAQIETPSLRLIVAFAILFFLTLLVAAFINYLAVQLIKKTGLSGTDRVIGIAFGLARGIVLVTVLVLLAGFTSVPRDPWWQRSALMHYFQDLAVWTCGWLPPEIAKNIRY